MATGALLGGAACAAPDAVEHGAGHLIDSRLSVEGTRWELLALADGAIAFVERAPDGSETGRVVRAAGQVDEVAVEVQTSGEVVSALVEPDGDPIGEVAAHDPTEIDELARVLQETFGDATRGRCPTCAAGGWGVVALVVAAIVALVGIGKRVRQCIQYGSYLRCELGCSEVSLAEIQSCSSSVCVDRLRLSEEGCVRDCATISLPGSLADAAVAHWRCFGDAVARCGTGAQTAACRDRLCPPPVSCDG